MINQNDPPDRLRPGTLAEGVAGVELDLPHAASCHVRPRGQTPRLNQSNQTMEREIDAGLIGEKGFKSTTAWSSPCTMSWASALPVPGALRIPQQV